jgi:hypothetical protein
LIQSLACNARVTLHIDQATDTEREIEMNSPALIFLHIMQQADVVRAMVAYWTA